VSAGGKRVAVGAGGGERGGVKDADVADAELTRDGGEFFPLRVSGDADEFEAVAVGGEDAQGVFTDGARGPEEDDAFAGARGGRVRG
jgi:hypothetical protein